MADIRYFCWNCGLMQGPEDAPQGLNRLCPSCVSAGIGKELQD